MTTAVEQLPTIHDQVSMGLKEELTKSVHLTMPTQTVQDLKQQHPLHQYDLTQMSKFYSACVGKLKEQHPEFHVNKWAEKKEGQQMVKSELPMSMVFSSKQQLYDAFQKLAMETGEPMIIMPNFDYGDIVNFERFLQALKQDGVNAIGKYKLYLNNKVSKK